MARAPPCQGGGREFESHCPLQIYQTGNSLLIVNYQFFYGCIFVLYKTLLGRYAGDVVIVIGGVRVKMQGVLWYDGFRLGRAKGIYDWLDFYMITLKI